jgi:CBS domain-containing protein
MKVREVMTRDVYVANPQNSIREVARVMTDIDCGSVPVGENDRLVGMVTDRDIAIRAVGQDKGPDTRVEEVMTRDLRYCYEDEDLEHVTHNMGEQQIRRLPVVDRDKRLVGILSLGDVAMSTDCNETSEALTGISRPGGLHSQTGASASL